VGGHATRKCQGEKWSGGTGVSHQMLKKMNQKEKSDVPSLLVTVHSFCLEGGGIRMKRGGLCWGIAGCMEVAW